jgi:hypothetical protein
MLIFLKSFWQAVLVVTFKNLIPTDLLMLLMEDLFCVKIVGRNTRCTKVMFVSVNTGGTGEFWGFMQSCALLRSTAPRHCAVDCRRFGTSFETPRTPYPKTWRCIPESRYLRWYVS